MKAVYSRKLSVEGQPLRYLGGFEFQHVDAHSRPAVNRLMNRIASMLGFGGDSGPGSTRG